MAFSAEEALSLNLESYVQNIIGICSVATLFLRTDASWMPLISPIIMSRRIREYDSRFSDKASSALNATFCKECRDLIQALP